MANMDASGASGDNPAARVAMQVNARDGLKLRAGPGIEFEVLKQLALGTTVYPLKSNGAWTSVDLKGDGAVDGFVSAGLLATAAPAAAKTMQPAVQSAAVGNLIASDTIKLSRIAAVSGGNQIVQSDICIRKAVGTLDIDLTMPGVAGLTVRGTGNANADGSVSWSIDQDVDATYEGNKLKHVKGVVFAGIASLAPSTGTNCEGLLPRTFAVSLTPMAAKSSLTITALFLGFDVHRVVSQIELTGTAGQSPGGTV